MKTINDMHFTCACMMHVFGIMAQPREIEKTSHGSWIFVGPLPPKTKRQGPDATRASSGTCSHSRQKCAHVPTPNAQRARSPSAPPSLASKAAPEKKEKAAEARHLMCVCVCDVTVQQLPSALLLTVWVFVWHVCAKKRCVCGEIAW